LSAPEELGRLLRERQGEHRLPSVSAAVLVRGEVAWAEAVGVAGAEAGSEATPDTQYRVGSITKTFTAAAILALRDEGKLDLDDPLGRHLVEAGDRPLTLRRMLAHSSGVQREVPGSVWETFEFPETGDELLERLAEAEHVLEPGAHWHYSNLAFALLGEVVSHVTGKPLERFVEERFLGPLGLSRTSWKRSEPAARGYYVDPWSDVLRPEIDLERSGAAAAAGDLWSTASDLCRWAAFLVGRDDMHTVQVMADPDRWTQAWGLGVSLYRRGDRILFGHGGAMPGYLAHLACSRTEGIGSAVLTNASTPAHAVQTLGLDLAEKAIELFPAEPELWAPGDPPPPELDGVLGRWWSEGTEFVFRWRGGRLEARLDIDPRERGPSVFEPESPDRYRTVSGRERGEPLVIVRDGDGAVAKLYWATYPFTRDPKTFGS